MKKILAVLLATMAFSMCFSAQEEATPELLKQTTLFNDYKKFDNPAIYMDLQADANLLGDYESRTADFKDSQLYPIIMAYMATRNFDKAAELLEKHMKAVPENMAAPRCLASIHLLKNDKEKAIELYKKAYNGGDNLALKSLASAYLIMNTPTEIKALVDNLKKLASSDMEAANILLMYAFSLKNPDEVLAKEVINSLNIDKIFKNASVDSFNSILNVYARNPNLWEGEVCVIPAMAAALNNLWFPANEAYDKALKANPKNTYALKGKALVEYRTGDVKKAFDLIKQSIALGDENAYNDLVELALISKHFNEINQAKDKIAKAQLKAQPKMMLVQYSIANDGNADLFFIGALGKNTETFYKVEQLKSIIKDGLKKYASDARAKEVEKLLK